MRAIGVAIANLGLMRANQLSGGRMVDAAGTDTTVRVDVAVTVSMSVGVADGVTVMVERVVVKSWKMLVETEGSVCVMVDTCCVHVNGDALYRVSDKVVVPVTAVDVAKCAEDVVVPKVDGAVSRAEVDVESYKTSGTVKSCAKTTAIAAKNTTNILE